jgi:23S rRNA (adenine2503-C2)-methyltransferase
MSRCGSSSMQARPCLCSPGDLASNFRVRNRVPHPFAVAHTPRSPGAGRNKAKNATQHQNCSTAAAFLRMCFYLRNHVSGRAVLDMASTRGCVVAARLLRGADNHASRRAGCPIGTTAHVWGSARMAPSALAATCWHATVSSRRRLSTITPQPNINAPLVNLVGLPKEQLLELCTRTHPGLLSPYAALALFRAVHREGLTSLADFALVSEARRVRLQAVFTIDAGTIVSDQLSADGTRKWLIAFAGAPTLGGRPGRPAQIETVFIPEKSAHGVQRGVLCVSSQVGCTLACTHCHTGTQALLRNLSHHEIVGQVVAARRALGDFPARPGGAVTNIVAMGQGEPLYNKRNVWAATRVCTDDNGCAIPHRKFTISTAGVAPFMPAIGGELNVGLALSLHAPNDALRSRIMAINNTYNLAAVIEACRGFMHSRTEQGGAVRRVVLEYTLLAGVNDSEAHAAQLVALIRDNALKVHLNLIPFNPWPGAPYDTPDDGAVMTFGCAAIEAGVSTTIRYPRGRDILAACGQLRSQLRPGQTEHGAAAAAAREAPLLAALQAGAP